MSVPEDLLPVEKKIREQLGHLPLDTAPWRPCPTSSAALPRSAVYMEADVLAPDRLSWTSFVGLWVLWVWGEMEAREFASAVGISHPTATGVASRLAPSEQESLAAMLRTLLRAVDAGAHRPVE